MTSSTKLVVALALVALLVAAYATAGQARGPRRHCTASLS
jgi:hypothetical protein